MKTKNLKICQSSVIENKIDSKEIYEVIDGREIFQTERLYDDFHKKAKKTRFVFLTLGSEQRPKNDNFIHLTYSDILPILERLSKSSNGNTKLLIENYLKTLSRLIMSQKFEAFSEKTKLYQTYSRVIKEVTDAWKENRNHLREAVENKIKNSEWWDENDWQMDTVIPIAIQKKEWMVNKDETKDVFLKLHLLDENLNFTLEIFAQEKDFREKFAEIFDDVLKNKIHAEIKIDKHLNTLYTEPKVSLLEEKDPVARIMKSLDKVVKKFENAIDMSIKEYKENTENKSLANRL